LKLGEFDESGNFTEGNQKGGFELTIPNSGGSDGIYKIVYTTYYDIKDANNPKDMEYENKPRLNGILMEQFTILHGFHLR
jgi:hypothetical protein